MSEGDRHYAQFKMDPARAFSLVEFSISGSRLGAVWESRPTVMYQACSTRLSALQYLKLLIDNEIAKEILES